MGKTKGTAMMSTFVFCFCFWLLVTWSVSARDLILGVLVSLAAALFSARFFVHEDAGFNLIRFLKAVFYALFTFLGELIKANWDVAKRSLSPNMKLNPGIVKVPTECKSEYELAMLANSITLTPGTITMDIVEEDEKNYIYIHWIDVAELDREKAGDAIKGTLEKGVRGVWK